MVFGQNGSLERCWSQIDELGVCVSRRGVNSCYATRTGSRFVGRNSRTDS